MSANSISHLLHVNTAAPPLHTPSSGSSLNYPGATSAGARPVQIRDQHHLQATSVPHPGVSISPDISPHLTPTTSIPQHSINTNIPLTHPQNASPVTPQGPSGRGHSLTQALYQCADCQRRYSRPEHLARHIQTHTLGKRFFCQVCGKAFARADLLKRHTANHDNDDDPAKKRRRTDASPNGGRVSHACRACATARVKCDEVKPCTRCRNRNLACEFNSTGMVPGPVHHAALSGQSNTDSSSAQQDHWATSSSQLVRDSQIGSSAVKLEEGHLPTPETLNDQSGQLGAFANMAYPSQGAVDVAKLPFSDFLRDVLYEQSLNAPRPEEAQGLAVLNFCDDANYELTDIDFGLLDHWNVDEMNHPQAATQAVTPQAEDSPIDLSQMRQKLVKIWTNSPWRWIPDTRDGIIAEYGNISLPSRDVASQRFQDSQKRADRIVPDKVDASSRDKMLMVVLQAVNTDAMRMRIASSFPSADVMDTMVHIFLAAHTCSVSSWIHWGTFSLESQWPEWIALVAAAGAVLTSVPTLRKFGFAVQEAIRMALPNRFEENNTGICNLGLVQSLVLSLDIGLWSGNRRKMEIAECHLLVPITMMRYRGKFQRSSYPLILVEETDEGEVLENKWRRWHEAESWKRLIFHCYLRDAQSSMTTFAPVTISFSELTLPLPDAKELWFARNATEWKRQVLSRSTDQNRRVPSLADLVRDIDQLTLNYQRLDAQFAISIYLHSFWSLIQDWRRLSAVHRTHGNQSAYQSETHMLLKSRHQELRRSIQNFRAITSDWHASLSAQENLLLNLLMMNLHVSMDDLQLFAGKEGEEQARRVYPLLQHWADSADARRAVCNAGQILRQAKLFPSGHLKDFYAIAVHHAALALWVYGVVVKATRSQSTPGEQRDTVLIDAGETSHVQRFIELNQGRPSIRIKEDGPAAPLDDPKASMDVVVGIFRGNFVAGQEMPPAIVENLTNMVKQLGEAQLALLPAAIVATTVITTVALLSLARWTLYPVRGSVIPGPLTTTIPKLSKEELAKVPYQPDHFPGARDVVTPYGNIRVYEFGPETGRKVLFLHGISTSCMTLSAIAEELAAKGCRVMLYDLFGRGYSDGVGDLPFDTRLFISQILLVLASSHLAWTGDNAFSIIGYSLGGGIAANFAATFPHLVESLVLLAPAGMIRPENFGRLTRLIFTSGIIPEGILEKLTKKRLRTPIGNAVAKRRKASVAQPLEGALDGGPGKEGLVEAAVQEAVDTTVDDDTPESVDPLEAKIASFVHWMLDAHDGFVPAFMSTIRHAPLMEQQEYWRQLGRRKPGTTAVILGRADELIQKTDYAEDALPLLGGEANVLWRIVPGGHNFPFLSVRETLDTIYEFWGM
ncbi:hypothetical protein BX600DRAFT_394947 [Xylariales sp. PMI_506]|nr:hypothetical protein BX600DRAFT_394947 [Xylariales sp. PMI_506]